MNVLNIIWFIVFNIDYRVWIIVYGFKKKRVENGIYIYLLNKYFKIKVWRILDWEKKINRVEVVDIYLYMYVV